MTLRICILFLEIHLYIIAWAYEEFLRINFNTQHFQKKLMQNNPRKSFLKQSLQRLTDRPFWSLNWMVRSTPTNPPNPWITTLYSLKATRDSLKCLNLKLSAWTYMQTNIESRHSWSARKEFLVGPCLPTILPHLAQDQSEYNKAKTKLNYLKQF